MQLPEKTRPVHCRHQDHWFGFKSTFLLVLCLSLFSSGCSKAHDSMPQGKTAGETAGSVTTSSDFVQESGKNESVEDGPDGNTAPETGTPDVPDTGSTRRLSASSDAGSTSFLETTSLETTSLETTSLETTSLEATFLEATPVENSSAGNSSAPYTLKYIDAWKEWHTMEVDPSVNACIYDPELFIEEDGSMKYQDDRYEVLHGVDVSEHQGYIDWEAVARAGYSFAFIRVGYRGYGKAGSLNEDAAAVDNLRRAKAAGLRVGTYIFSQALNEEEARAEADLAVGVIMSSGVETDLPLMYDPELIKDDWGRANDITRGQVSLNTAAFRDQVEKTSALTIDIYSNLPWEHHYFDTDTMNQYEIWYADYEKAPQTPYHFAWWQYTNEGHVPGIDGEVDLNVWLRLKDA